MNDARHSHASCLAAPQNLPVKMSLAISVAGTLSCLDRLLWGAHLCSSGLTLGESVCQTRPNMMDRAIYLNTAAEI